MSYMAIIYANLIHKGKKVFDEVPEKNKDEVKQILIDLGYENLISKNN